VPVKAMSAVADTVELPSAKHIRTPDEVIADVNEALQDAYFAYDRDEISTEALAALRRDAELLCGILAEFPEVRVVVEGHCDERGSAEYNLGLGDRRARRALAVLRDFGVAAGAVDAVSYGKESPQCAQSTEACYQKNRRAHLSVRAPETR
jgi:peptidoglycan-associated lipoprotein